MRLPIAVVIACLLAGVLAAQAPTEQQKPTFRAGVNFVRLDVYPTANGRPVADLGNDDFEILEDGVPQKLETFEHVAVRPREVTDERLEVRSLAESQRMAADAHNRLFVLFLDTYHVTDDTTSHNGRIRFSGHPTEPAPASPKPLGPGRIDKALVNFITRTVGPTDLFALLTPDMEAEQLSFTRRPDGIEELLRTVWGRRFAWDDLDPEEERWNICYLPDDMFHCYDGVLEGMVLRRREMKTIERLGDLVTRLQDLRDGRKAVIVVSEGWALLRPDSHLARPLPKVSNKGCQAQIPSAPPITVDADGKPRIGDDPRRTTNKADWNQCEAARIGLANADIGPMYRELLDRANRANVSFYPVDPRGLAVFDVPIDAANPGHLNAPVTRLTQAENQSQLRERLETLRSLATATDGKAMVTSNDIAGSLKQISDDLSDYYLLGYYSSNSKPDGKFRRITVRVKRQGVSVRARRGYLAVSEAEAAARLRAERGADPEIATRDSALASLDGIRADRPVRLTASYAWDENSRSVVWAVTEMDMTMGRRPPWNAGADAVVTIALPGEQPFATEQVSLGPTSLRSLVRFPMKETGGGEYLIRVKAKGKAAGSPDATDLVRVIVLEPDSAALLSAPPLFFRRGPFTGPGFQPTADMRFRKAERLRMDIALVADVDSLAARLLDRNGQALPIPVTAAPREEAGSHFASAEVALAPLAPGDYVIELSVAKGMKSDKTVAAFRVIP